MTDRASSAGPENERDQSTVTTDTTDSGREGNTVVENRSTETGANQDAANAAADSSAKSPDADPKDAKKAEPSFRDVVKAALAPKTDPAAASSTASSDGSTAPDPKAADGTKDAGADKGKGADEVPPEFHKHPAWQRILGERDTARADLDRIKPEAEQYGKITGFMTEHQLSPEMVGEGFTIMAMMRSGKDEDLREALKHIDVYRERILLSLGDKLPEDLQAKVDKGLVDDETAKEVAKTRLANASAATRATTAESAAETARKAREADAAAKATSDMQTAVGNWEAANASRDPDYSKKRQLVRDRSYRLMQADHAATGKVPASPDDAVALAKRAYAELAQELGWNAAAPRTPTKTTKTPTGRPASTATPEAATSMKGAVAAALGRR